MVKRGVAAPIEERAMREPVALAAALRKMADHLEREVTAPILPGTVALEVRPLGDGVRLLHLTMHTDGAP